VLALLAGIRPLTQPLPLGAQRLALGLEARDPLAVSDDQLGQVAFAAFEGGDLMGEGEDLVLGRLLGRGELLRRRPGGFPRRLCCALPRLCSLFGGP
jgi:hypothetical protein